MTTFALTDTLSDLPYFNETPPALLARLAQHMTRCTYRAGEIIFLEGEPSRGLWIVEHGSVKIYKLHPDGTELALRLIGKGGTFDDIAALDGGSNPASAAALSDVAVWVLPGDVLVEAMLSDSRLAVRVARVLAARQRLLVQHLETLTLYNVMVRLARFLLQQADDPALSGPGITRVAIAAHLATTPQTLSGALTVLAGAGAIRFTRQQVSIERRDVLRSIAMLQGQ